MKRKIGQKNYHECPKCKKRVRVTKAGKLQAHLGFLDLAPCDLSKRLIVKRPQAT